MPVWCSEDMEEVVVIGSIAELEGYAGRKITDIHRHFIDDITIPSKRAGVPPLRRVDYVFDWCAAPRPQTRPRTRTRGKNLS